MCLRGRIKVELLTETISSLSEEKFFLESTNQVLEELTKTTITNIAKKTDLPAEQHEKKICFHTLNGIFVCSKIEWKKIEEALSSITKTILAKIAMSSIISNNFPAGVSAS